MQNNATSRTSFGLNAITYKEMIQGFRSKFIYFCLLLLTLGCIGSFLFLKTDHPYTPYGRLPIIINLSIYLIYCWLIFLWNIQQTLLEVNRGNYSIIELSGQSPSQIILSKVLSFFGFCYIGLFIVYPLQFAQYTMYTHTLPIYIYPLFLAPFVLLPGYLLALQIVFLTNKYLRNTLSALSILLPIAIVLGEYFIFVQIFGRYSGNYFKFWLSSVYSLNFSFLVPESLYAAGLYALINSLLFIKACHLLSTDTKTYGRFIKIITLITLGYILIAFIPMLHITETYAVLSIGLRYLFFLTFLSAFSPIRNSEPFSRIVEKKKPFSSRYLSPGKQTNLRFFLLLAMIILFLGTTLFANIAAYGPRFLRLLIYPFYIAGIFRLQPDQNTLSEYSTFIKTALFFIVILIEEFIIPTAYIQELSPVIRNCVFYSCTIIGLYWMLNDHYSKNKRKNKPSHSLKQFLLERVKTI